MHAYINLYSTGIEKRVRAPEQLGAFRRHTVDRAALKSKEHNIDVLCSLHRKMAFNHHLCLEMITHQETQIKSERNSCKYSMQVCSDSTIH